jgi:hypothetical protein
VICDCADATRVLPPFGNEHLHIGVRPELISRPGKPSAEGFDFRSVGLVAIRFQINQARNLGPFQHLLGTLESRRDKIEAAVDAFFQRKG